jgi:hypothetical protein
MTDNISLTTDYDNATRRANLILRNFYSELNSPEGSFEQAKDDLAEFAQLLEELRELVA